MARQPKNSRTSMPWDANYVPHDDTVVVTHTGEVSLRDAQEQANLVISLLKQTKASRLLFDYADATMDIPAADLATLPDYYTLQGVPHDRRIAYLISTAEDRAHPFIYFQILARQKGFDISLFNSKDAAMQWLKTGSLFQ
jgi:hypothetical protein